MKTFQIIFTCVLLTAPLAEAHVVLAEGEAPADSYYKATFRVGHGCEQSPTTSIKVFIPDHVVSIRPQPKIGWNLETRTGKLVEPYVLHGKTFDEGVTQVTWSGGELPNEHFDEFSMMVRTPTQAGDYWFRVLQECPKGENDWQELPGDGQSWGDLKRPAVLLKVIPGRKAHHH